MIRNKFVLNLVFDGLKLQSMNKQPVSISP
jgi:hypothetical protein